MFNSPWLDALANAAFILGIIALSAVPIGALITLCKGEQK
jgi:hypothetical protein